METEGEISGGSLNQDLYYDTVTNNLLRYHGSCTFPLLLLHLEHTNAMLERSKPLDAFVSQFIFSNDGLLT